MSATPEASELISRRHDEWRQNCVRWRFLQDSLEGGDRYRYAVYGTDLRGLPVMNLIRHKREYPHPDKQNQYVSSTPVYSAALIAQAGALGLIGQLPTTDDDFFLRLVRTPIPTFVSEAVGRHLNRIFGREVKRKGPADLMAWWDDVDGAGTSIDQWMSKDVGPLLLTLGQLDILFDRPQAEGIIETRAQESEAGVDKCLATIILPENMLWWKKDRRDRYTECLVLEHFETERGLLQRRYRHWTRDGWTLYDDEGNKLGDGTHPYGRPPIVRVFDRKKVRCRNVGQSEYEPIAEHMKEYYNRDSELILSDVMQAHAILSGPEDYCHADGSLEIGPSFLLPKKKSDDGSSYEGFEYIDPPKGGAEGIRTNKQDIRDSVDRIAALNKPAGATGGSTVAQSGISKSFDNQDLNDLLTRRVQTLEKAECRFAEMALFVATGKPVDHESDAIDVRYPTEFDLHSADDLAKAGAEIQGVVSTAGTLPETEFELISRLVRLALPGLADERYKALDSEIKSHLDDAHDLHQQNQEAQGTGLQVTLQNMMDGGTVTPAVPKPDAPATPPQPAGKPTADPKPKAPKKAKVTSPAVA